MPAKSRAQFRGMKAVEHGAKLDKFEGLSRRQAAEYTGGQSYKSLPEKAKKKGKGRGSRNRRSE